MEEFASLQPPVLAINVNALVILMELTVRIKLVFVLQILVKMKDYV